jgi:hypothetical protein
MIITANQLGGRAVGSIFFSGFGALWIILALYIQQTLSFDLGIGVGSVLAALLLTALWLLRQAKRFPRLPEDRRVSRDFNRINAMQWVAVGIVGFSFSRLHIDAYVLSAITAIVGIHLFPLAKLFRYPLHNLTGTILVVWASASMMIVPVDRLQGVTAIGTGVILLLSAALTLAIAARVALVAGSSQAGMQSKAYVEALDC